jgi:hypothetical protein
MGKALCRPWWRIVAMHVANDFVIDAERMAFGLTPGMLMAPVPYHEVWTLAAFERSCAAYYEAGLRAPVRVMPHLWNSTLIDRGAAGKGDLATFCYSPGRERWRLAILEPNVCTVKTCHVPMLVCDMAHRLNPRAIEFMRVYNAVQLREHAGFVSFAKGLDLIRHGMATFEARFPVFEILGKECDAVVSHHWENAQNYLYYEALYGGFPLIHNSDLLGSCGYRYKSYDPEDGALALLAAIAQHDYELDYYRRAAFKYLARLDPKNDENVAFFSDVIASLFENATIV